LSLNSSLSSEKRWDTTGLAYLVTSESLILLSGCGRGPNSGKSFEIIPLLIFSAVMVGVLWFIGQLIDKKSNFADSVLSGLIALIVISAVLSLIVKILN
jgi:hypothetical protein